MLKVHFLNVGHGDCTIIEHPSARLTMIDVNNAQEYDKDTVSSLVTEAASTIAFQDTASVRSFSSILDEASSQVVARAKRELTDPIQYVKENFPGRKLWRFVLTHPDLDHMRGLKRLHEEIGFDNFWDTNNAKIAPSFRGDADKVDWSHYQSVRAGAKLYYRGNAHFAFARDKDGTAGGDSIEILSPTPDLVAGCNEAEVSNDISLVLRITHAGVGVLLPGDAEERAWDGMVAAYGKALKSRVLKASHHGRDSGFHAGAVDLIAPVVTVVSVGTKPSTDATRQVPQQVQSSVFNPLSR